MSPSRSSRWSAIVVALGLGLVGGVLAAQRGVSWLSPRSRTTLSESMVVERLESVAKLITTEAVVRDVITYQNTWLGSTKRSLVIATGKALVGLDLAADRSVSIRQQDRHITFVLPPARLLGVDVIEMRTYDERRGLWNPFVASDRDTVFMLARRQLAAAAQDPGVLAHAEESARRFLSGLFASEQYTVDVTFAAASPVPAVPQ